MDAIARLIRPFLLFMMMLCGGMAVQAQDTILLPGADFFPEGIAYDGRGGFYVGSLTRRQILYLGGAGRAPAVFVDSANTPGLLSFTGLYVDQERQLLYACSTDTGVVKFDGESQPSLLAFDLRNPSDPLRYPLPGGGFCNDMIMDDDGTLYVTDSHRPRILILRPGAKDLVEWLAHDLFAGEGVNLNGIVLAGDALYVVKSNSGALFRVTRGANSATVTEVVLPRPLEFPDGLELLPDGRLLVVEGSGKLTAISLTGATATLHPLAEGLDVPTTVAVAGDRALVVQAQLDHLFDPEKAGQPAPFQIKSIALK